MLLRFAASNHRSLRESTELSLIAVDEDRPAARSFDLLPERVLTIAGIYGANASGKSNVLDAIRWLSSAVRSSLLAWGDKIPRDPFRLHNSSGEVSTYEIEMMVAGVRYRYLLEVDDDQVLYEILQSFPKKLPRTLFEREGEELEFRRGQRGLPGTRELLGPTTLVLSAAARIPATGEIRSFARALSSIGVFGLRRRPRRFVRADGGSAMFAAGLNWFARTERLFIDSEGAPAPEDGSQRLALSLLRFADLGIAGVKVTREPDSPGDNTRPRVQLLHKSEGDPVPFEVAEESDGTQTWFRLIGPLIRALETGQTLLFDEIDASLHPALSARLLELFKDPVSNPLGAQLIFTTHDTSLLGHLNRDEVWLTEKSEAGSTRLTALAEFGGDKVRRSLNLERAYMQGRFGALPSLDASDLAPAFRSARLPLGPETTVKSDGSTPKEVLEIDSEGDVDVDAVAGFGMDEADA